MKSFGILKTASGPHQLAFKSFKFNVLKCAQGEGGGTEIVEAEYCLGFVIIISK